MKDLYNHVIPIIAPKWCDLSIQLLRDTRHVEQIKSNSSGNVEKCAAMMFELWLQKKSDASWNELIAALRNIELLAVAHMIKSMLYKGMYLLMHICIYNPIQKQPAWKCKAVCMGIKDQKL